MTLAPTLPKLIIGAMIGLGCGAVSGLIVGLCVMITTYFMLKENIRRIKYPFMWFCILPTCVTGIINVPFGFLFNALSDEGPGEKIRTIFIWAIVTTLVTFFVGCCVTIIVNRIYERIKRYFKGKRPWEYSMPNEYDDKMRLVNHVQLIVFGGFLGACIGSSFGSLVGIIIEFYQL